MNERRIELSIGLSHPADRHIAVVVARTNDFVTSALASGAQGVLRSAGIGRITVVEVAGAFELVAASAQVLKHGADGVIAVGAVVRGDTPHFDYICDAVTGGLAALASQGHAVAFGVLTVDTATQAADRAGGALGNKGAEAAQALLQLLSAMERL